MIPEPVGDEAVYLFLDELAADGVITLNGVVKPYSRLTIKEKLEEAAAARDVLTSGREPAAVKDMPAAREENTSAVSGAKPATLTLRQQKELDFWLNIYSPGEADGKLKLLLNPATAYYRDSLFSVTVSPILGLTGGATFAGAMDYAGADPPDGTGGGSPTRTIAWKKRCEGLRQL